MSDWLILWMHNWFYTTVSWIQVVFQMLQRVSLYLLFMLSGGISADNCTSCPANSIAISGSSQCQPCPIGLASPSQSSKCQLSVPYSDTLPQCAIPDLSMSKVMLMEKQNTFPPLASSSSLGCLSTNISNVWACIQHNYSSSSCPKPPDLACFVFWRTISPLNIGFYYWGANSDLNLVKWNWRL